MNRLKRQRVYLAGAMDRVPDRGATWRENITPFLKDLGLVVFNPIKKQKNLFLMRGFFLNGEKRLVLFIRSI